MIEQLLSLVPQSLSEISGTVLYSGRSAFSSPTDLYVLGLNPGGSADRQAAETVAWHTDKVLRGSSDWSAYCDESWDGSTPGTYGMQPGVLNMFRRLNKSPRHIPASNVVFVRSSTENELGKRFQALAELCWPFHEAVIERLGIRVILCFGRRAGDYVRKRLNALEQVDEFVELNNRRWTSRAFRNTHRQYVVVATHPSRADWTTPAADPSPLVKRVLEIA